MPAFFLVRAAVGNSSEIVSIAEMRLGLCSLKMCSDFRHWVRTCYIDILERSSHFSHVQVRPQIFFWKCKATRLGSSSALSFSSKLGYMSTALWPRLRSPVRHKVTCQLRSHRTSSPSTTLVVASYSLVATRSGRYWTHARWALC